MFSITTILSFTHLYKSNTTTNSWCSSASPRSRAKTDWGNYTPTISCIGPLMYLIFEIINYNDWNIGKLWITIEAYTNHGVPCIVCGKYLKILWMENRLARGVCWLTISSLFDHREVVLISIQRKENRSYAKVLAI